MDTIYCIVSLVYLISFGNPKNLYRKWCETLKSPNIFVWKYLNLTNKNIGFFRENHKMFIKILEIERKICPLKVLD